MFAVVHIGRADYHLLPFGTHQREDEMSETETGMLDFDCECGSRNWCVTHIVAGKFPFRPKGYDEDITCGKLRVLMVCRDCMKEYTRGVAVATGKDADEITTRQAEAAITEVFGVKRP